MYVYFMDFVLLCSSGYTLRKEKKCSIYHCVLLLIKVVVHIHRLKTHFVLCCFKANLFPLPGQCNFVIIMININITNLFDLSYDECNKEKRSC